MNTPCELYDVLYNLIEKINEEPVTEHDRFTYNNKDGYDIVLTPSEVILKSENYTNVLHIDLETWSKNTSVYRNKICLGSTKQIYITSINTNIDINDFDDSVYFNLSLLGHIPTKEHIEFAIRLQRLNNLQYKPNFYTIYPAFINLEKLKNTRL